MILQELKVEGKKRKKSLKKGDKKLKLKSRGPKQASELSARRETL
jgi:hypothetical protein